MYKQLACLLACLFVWVCNVRSVRVRLLGSPIDLLVGWLVGWLCRVQISTAASKPFDEG